MLKSIFSFVFLLFLNTLFGQAKVDLDASVPLWMEYDSQTNQSYLKWIADENAGTYYLSKVVGVTSLIPVDTLEGSATEFALGELIKGEAYDYHIRKDIVGRGLIRFGIEVPAVHIRGRCLIVIDDILPIPLDKEIDQLIEDLSMDGWQVDTLHVSQSEAVVAVKSKIVGWYDASNTNAQALFLLGHIPVPYSGNSAHDGHPDHQGAWAADVFYGDTNGNWTDVFVNNTTPSRAANKNIPGDGKYDQTGIPSNLEIDLGRVDFHDLPAFSDDEIELTRKYLIKNHEYKIGNKDYPRRAMVENNFSSFQEGFGQSGWRNFTTMFGGENVSVQNYESVLESEKYLFSYACGGGSYTSASGVGTTQNLWVAKDIQTIFTLTFGSYFGDWDSQNNFLRSALASGDVLTNAWAGRPHWQLYEMALGKHIGHCAKLSQDANGSFYSQGNSAKSAHIALMGDPTLRLHAVKRAENLIATYSDGNISLSWDESAHATHGYSVYRREEGAAWELIQNFNSNTLYTDVCVKGNTIYEYMVKTIRLEETGSGSYFNTSLGIASTVLTGDNLQLQSYYADLDMDGYGDPNNMTTACDQPPGTSINNLDCDDMNSDINPNSEEIPNNGIDEDCDGEDLLVSVNDVHRSKIKIYPNPTQDLVFIESDMDGDIFYSLYNAQGQLMQSGIFLQYIDLKEESDGLFWLELSSINSNQKVTEKIIVNRR